MNAESKLTVNDRHLMRLIRHSQNEDGWAKVSKMLMPIVSGLPSELVEFKPGDAGGLAKLTDKGNIVLDWI